MLASTNAVVGATDGDLHRGRSRCAPLTPYGSTKAAAEMLLSGYAGAYGLRTRRAPAHATSTDPAWDQGLLRAAAAPRRGRGRGRRRSTATATQRRDLVHVQRRGATPSPALSSGWPSGPIIIGSGSSVTVLDLRGGGPRGHRLRDPRRARAAQAGEMPAVRGRHHGSAPPRLRDPRCPWSRGCAAPWADFEPRRPSLTCDLGAVRSTGTGPGRSPWRRRALLRARPTTPGRCGAGWPRWPRVAGPPSCCAHARRTGVARRARSRCRAASAPAAGRSRAGHLALLAPPLGLRRARRARRPIGARSSSASCCGGWRRRGTAGGTTPRASDVASLRLSAPRCWAGRRCSRLLAAVGLARGAIA